jgi:hypothetical protein
MARQVDGPEWSTHGSPLVTPYAAPSRQTRTGGSRVETVLVEERTLPRERLKVLERQEDWRVQTAHQPTSLQNGTKSSLYPALTYTPARVLDTAAWSRLQGECLFVHARTRALHANEGNQTTRESSSP